MSTTLQAALVRLETCACGELIEAPYDDLPNCWHHLATGSPYCEPPKFARPVTGHPAETAAEPTMKGT